MKESLEKLRARAEVYRLLSQAYHTPQASFFEDDFLGLLKKAFDTLVLDPCATEAKNMEFYRQTPQELGELAIEYTRLFRGPVKAEAYPYESMYIEGEVIGNSTLDVVRQYGEASVNVSEEFKDLPDHISVEFEFMRYLCLHELDALQKGDDTEATHFRLMGQAFVKDHLSKWVLRFTGLVLEYAKTPFYRGIARITKEFINRETTLLENVVEKSKVP